MRLAPVPDWLLPSMRHRRIRVVIEELTRSVTPRLLIATLVTSAIAVAEMRALLGNAPDFLVARGAVTPVASLPYYLIAGALLGLLGVAYNATIVRFLDLFQWLQRLPALVPAAMVGLVIGLLAWFAPSFVGGGDFLAQTIIWNGLGHPRSRWCSLFASSRPAVIRAGHAGWPLCALAACRSGGKRATGRVRQCDLAGYAAHNGLRRRRNGGVLHRRGAHTIYWHHARG